MFNKAKSNCSTIKSLRCDTLRRIFKRNFNVHLGLKEMNENKNYQQSKCGPHSQVRQVSLFLVPLFPGSPVPRFPCSQVPLFPCSQVPLSPILKIATLTAHRPHTTFEYMIVASPFAGKILCVNNRTRRGRR
jgi:hypothetical protein